MIPIVIQALPRWDGRYASTSCNLAKELSKKRLVFYVDHPFTWKDVKTGDDRIGTLRPEIWSDEHEPFYRPFPDFPNFISVCPDPSLPVNALPEGKIYRLLIRLVNRKIWKVVDQVLWTFKVSEFIYINSFDPVFWGIATEKKVRLKIYHCVDNMAGERYIAKHGVFAEEKAARSADFTFSTSSALNEKMKAWNLNSFLIPNAADFSLFSKNVEKIPDDLSLIPEPRIMYTGNIGLRMDMDLIGKMAAEHPEWNIVLIGPKDLREFNGQNIENIPNVYFLGSKPYLELPEYLAGASVCIIPFFPDELTKFIYPLKINEYLGSGKPVVTTRFADLSEFENVVHITDSHSEFIDSVQLAIENNSEALTVKRKEFASENTWENRVNQIEYLHSDFLTEESVTP
ncbi:MAG: glycosyltransferase [Bacteroidetes bacterium]|nr:glycosyltransferase [Bacteroidota bacterium]